MTTLLGNLVIQWKLVVQKLFLILPGVSVVVVVLRRSFVGFSMGFEVFHLSTGTRSTSFFFSLLYLPTLIICLHGQLSFLCFFFFFFFFGGAASPFILVVNRGECHFTEKVSGDIIFFFFISKSLDALSTHSNTSHLFFLFFLFFYFLLSSFSSSSSF